MIPRKSDYISFKESTSSFSKLEGIDAFALGYLSSSSTSETKEVSWEIFSQVVSLYNTGGIPFYEKLNLFANLIIEVTLGVYSPEIQRKFQQTLLEIWENGIECAHLESGELYLVGMFNGICPGSDVIGIIFEIDEICTDLRSYVTQEELIDNILRILETQSKQYSPQKANDGFIPSKEVSIEKLQIQFEEEEKLSYDAIRMIIEEEEQQAEKIEKPVNCLICLEDITREQAILPIEGCEHIFHHECFCDFLKSKIDERAFPIKCPGEKCKNEIGHEFLKDCLGDPKYLKYQLKLEEFSFKSFTEKHADEYSCCPTADCKYIFVYEEGVNEFACPNCNKEYCLKCKTEWHKNMTCEQYQTQKQHQKDEYIIEFVKGKNYKQCPQCKFWVERTEGCDAMSCRCGTQFCYRCGKRGDGHLPCTQHR